MVVFNYNIYRAWLIGGTHRAKCNDNTYRAKCNDGKQSTPTAKYI